MIKRTTDRTKGVLPVTISGCDEQGRTFHEVAHPLDVTANGAKIGGIHRRIRLQDLVVLQHRHRKIQFKVIWLKLLKGTTEYQIGLQAVRPGDSLRG